MDVRPEFTADADGYFVYMSRPGRRFSEGTARKWMPIIRDYDRLGTELGLELAEINDATIEFLIIPAMIDAYRRRYDAEPTANTLRGWWDALRSYYEYLEGTRRVSMNFMNLVPKPTCKTHEILHLLPEEDKALVGCEKDPLEAIVIGLLRANGLRAGEARDLGDDDIDEWCGHIHIRDGKTPAAVRTLPIAPALLPVIRAYREHKQTVGIRSDRFLATKKSGTITSQYIWVIVKRVAARAGVRLHLDEKTGKPIALDKSGQNVSAVSPHVLRKTYGMDLINSGVAIAIVSDLLGQAHERVTEEAYARPLKEIVAGEALRAASKGPYGTVKALDAVEADAGSLCAELDPQAQLERIRALRETLDAIEDAVTLLAA